LECFAKNCAALILGKTSAFNQPVAVFLPKSVEAIIANLGALYTGNCYANLDIKSPRNGSRTCCKTFRPAWSLHRRFVRRSCGRGVSEDRLILVENVFAERLL